MAKIYIQKTERAKLEHIILTQSQKAEDNTIVLKKINRQYNSELLNYLNKDVITVVNYYLDDEININIVAKIIDYAPHTDEELKIMKRYNGSIVPEKFIVYLSIIIYNTYINYKNYYLCTYLKIMCNVDDKLFCHLQTKACNGYMTQYNVIDQVDSNDFKRTITFYTSNSPYLYNYKKQKSATIVNKTYKKMTLYRHGYFYKNDYNNIYTVPNLICFFDKYMKIHYKKNKYLGYKKIRYNHKQTNYDNVCECKWSDENNKKYYQMSCVILNHSTNLHIVDVVVNDDRMVKNTIVIFKVLVDNIISIVKNDLVKLYK